MFVLYLSERLLHLWSTAQYRLNGPPKNFQGKLGKASSAKASSIIFEKLWVRICNERLEISQSNCLVCYRVIISYLLWMHWTFFFHFFSLNVYNSVDILCAAMVGQHRWECTFLATAFLCYQVILYCYYVFGGMENKLYFSKTMKTSKNWHCTDISK